MNPHERGRRVQLVLAAKRLGANGMNPGKSGNLSVRIGGGFVVTPSGLACENLESDDLVLVLTDVEGVSSGGPRAPSSEWRLHRDIYERHPEAQAVVHTHSPFATTLACLRRPIPAFHYEVALAGGADIRCGGYATFGTQELSDQALAALQGRRACLLANHGSVACGESIADAVALAEKVESLARLYWQALQIGEPALLDEVEMARVIAKFGGYGRS